MLNFFNSETEEDRQIVMFLGTKKWTRNRVEFLDHEQIIDTGKYDFTIVKYN